VSDDKRVTGRSDAEVRRIADRTKSEYRVSGSRPVNILRYLESGSVSTIYGRKKLIFRVVDDAELGNADAKTEFGRGTVTISVKRSVRDRAEVGSGRDRMTLAHELAHAVMHHGTPLFRLLNASGPTSLAQEKAYESAEHQAKVFAAAFLIHDEDAAQMSDAEQISIQFGVSLEAANICFERLKRKAEYARSAERVRKIADETIKALRGKVMAKPPTYLDHLCTICHEKMLTPIGNKVVCNNKNCGYVGDHFQDGDKLN
jgi:hypothetical protein